MGSCDEIKKDIYKVGVPEIQYAVLDEDAEFELSQRAPFMAVGVV